jgi:ATP-dependent Clp protease ATP-binding subunit ClpC
MYERFSERARHVVVLAHEEARLFRRDQVGSEHLLLGVLAEGGPGAETLSAADVTLERARAEVARVAGSGATDAATAAPARWTTEAKKGHDQAVRVALALGHARIAPEHLLVGLLNAGDGTAARILDGLQVPREQVREAVMARLAAEGPGEDRAETFTGLPVDSGNALLAIARLPDGLAASALAQLGVTYSALRDAVERARRDADAGP